MNGSRLFILVLLLVLAIPLMAAHTLVNPVGEFSAISTMNTEEVSFTDQELFDSNIAVLSVGIKKTYLYNYNKVDKVNDSGTDNYIINRSNKTGYNNSKRGGNLRFASGH